MSATEWLAIATIIAVLAGPVLAVIVTRYIDELRSQRHRRLEIFRDLMVFRGAQLTKEFVGALNLIQIEFSSDPTVIEAWKKLHAHFGSSPPLDTEEEATKKYLEVRGQLLVRLLDAMAKSLNIKIEQLDIYSGGYTPQGWNNLELEQGVIRRLFGEIAMGQKTFPVTVTNLPLGQPQSVDEKPIRQSDLQGQI